MTRDSSISQFNEMEVISRATSQPERPYFDAARASGTAEVLGRYAEWLRERRDARAEWVAALAVTRDPASAPEPRRVAADRLEALRLEIPRLWSSMLAPNSGPFNCHAAPDDAPEAVRFAYECPRTWDSLTPTDDPSVRACEACAESVFLCTTRDEAEAHARAGRCIAVTGPLAEHVRRSVTAGYTGRPHFPSAWAARLFGR